MRPSSVLPAFLPLLRAALVITLTMLFVGCTHSDPPQHDGGADALDARVALDAVVADAPDDGIALDTSVSDAATVTQSVGPAGGMVRVAGATLAIPSGALASPEDITVTVTTDPPPAAYTALSPVFRFEPSGLTFAVPVTVTLPFSGNAMGAAIYWTSASGSGFDRIGGTVNGAAMSASVTHFSSGFVGNATCDGQLDGTICNTDSAGNVTAHCCNHVCVGNNTVDHCGSNSCTPCRAPSNASASCDGAVCGFTCNAGFHLCNGACVDDHSVDSCGAACSPCSAPSHSIATCESTGCASHCAPGWADCDGLPDDGCEADLSDGSHCGACGTVCGAASPVCQPDGAGSWSCQSGCSGATPTRCGSSCVDITSDPGNCGGCGLFCPSPLGGNGSGACFMGHCTTTCNPGFHLCFGSVCQSDTDPNACGTACTPCTAPAHATPTCDGTACSFACDTGYHRCGDVCVSDSSVSSCGSSCSPCIAPGGANSTCDGRSCGFTCFPGSHACSGSCLNDASPLGCGPTSCTPCPFPAHASPTCDGTTCGFNCNPGFHPCGGACVANNDPATCGSACTACPAPANAYATCDGTSCGIACNAGYHLCGGVCVAVADPATCGDACMACPTPAHGSPTCSGVACGVVCDAGYHNCGGACVSNTDVATCGGSCTPCPTPPNTTPNCAPGFCDWQCNDNYRNCNGDASDGCEAFLGTASNCGWCGVVCSGATPVCQQDASTGTYSCQSGCATGQLRCGGSCVDPASDPLHCGSCATACPAPANARATCSSGTCGFVCNAGYHLCGGACVANTSVASCGSSCTACSAPANATPTCDGTACGISCIGGYHACGAACADNTSVATCGASCAPCSAPANASPTCDGVTCGYVCNTGFHACGGACVADNDPVHCGASCVTCPGTTNGVAVCNAGTCGFSCNAGYHLCGGACVRNDDPSTCGSSCAPCASHTNATATCDGTTCGFACNAGYHLCAGACVSNASVNSCGATACTACSAPPANATATCDGTTCGFACNAGYTLSGGVCMPAPPPRATAPLSAANVTSLRPVFRWTLPSGNDGARVEICRDRACAVPVTTFDAIGTSGAPSVDLPTGVLYWRLYGRAGGNTAALSSPWWEVVVGGRSGAVSSSWGTTLDVNGDGFADAVVGAYCAPYAGGPCGAGSAYVYLGSAAGLSTSPAITLTGPDGPGGSFGTSVASAGDINGDGYGDVVIGARLAAGSAGAAYVYLGGPSGLTATPATTLASPDGAGNNYGSSVASAGDVNGDGYADIVIGAYGYLSATGRAYVYLGGPSGVATTPARTLTGPDASGGFGYAVSSAGDVNADGYADVIIGAYAVVVGGAFNTGRAYLYLGSASGLAAAPATTLTGLDGSNGYFGYSVAGAGDVNGDGYPDVVIGARRAVADTGRVYVFHGGASGLSTVPATSLTGPDGGGGFFGGAVAGAGDVNGDGYGDVVVGADAVATNTGRAYLFLGTGSGVGTTAATTLIGSDGTNGHFGTAVASAGDVNGDHYSDVIVGAYGALSGTGRAYVHAGSAAGLGGTATVVLTGPDGASGYFGQSVASAATVSGRHRRPRT